MLASPAPLLDAADVLQRGPRARKGGRGVVWASRSVGMRKSVLSRPANAATRRARGANIFSALFFSHFREFALLDLPGVNLPGGGQPQK